MNTKADVLRWFKMRIELIDGQLAEANKTIIMAQAKVDILRDVKGDLIDLMKDVEKLKVDDEASRIAKAMEAQL